MRTMTMLVATGLMTVGSGVLAQERDAEQVCREAARQDGYEITAVTGSDEANNTIQLEIEMTRDGNRWEARCIPDPDNRGARLHDLERQD